MYNLLSLCFYHLWLYNFFNMSKIIKDHIHQCYIFFIILDNLYDLLYKLSRIIKKIFADAVI